MASRSRFCAFCVLIAWSIPPLCAANTDSGTKPKDRATARSVLKSVNDIVVKSELAQGFINPIRCDVDGNLYLMTITDTTSGIRKLSPKGERLANFVANSQIDLPVQHASYFTVDRDGTVYQLAFLRKMLDRAVIVFGKDGTYKGGINLEFPPGVRDWIPHQISVFPSGDLLIAASTFDPETRSSQPFTGIFGSGGAFKKAIDLADDADLQKMMESQDPQVVAPGHPFQNRAIDLGQAETGDDGNVYLMRRLSPAIVYAISPGGEAIRRFAVDPGSADYMPIAMHIAGSRIAILFEEAPTRKELVKVSDLEGHPLGSYQEQMKGDYAELGSALACYSQNPERFTFLFTDENGYLGFHIAEPR